ncbi:MAG: ATP-binding protein, partial [Anaeromyxobacteraceae bacterium]
AAEGLEAAALPYPEIASTSVVRWTLPVGARAAGAGDAHWLLLYLEREPPNPAQYRGMLLRLGAHLGAALEHRALYERVLASERSLKELNDELEQRVAARTDELAAANRELTGSLRSLEETQHLLLHAGKMASLGQLAAGVAHEINNPLAYVLANVGFSLGLARDASPSSELVQSLEGALNGIERIRRVVRDLSTFARPDDEGATPFADVAEAVRTSSMIAQTELRHRARLELDVQDVPLVSGSPHRIGQVLLNLLINAAQAIPAGRVEENEVKVSVRPAGDHRVLIEVRDTGEGIDPAVLPRIFDPFFTTKPIGVGTGIGLSICHGIVTNLGGEISVESRRGGGSVFRVLLPEAAEPSPAPAGTADGLLARR